MNGKILLAALLVFTFALGGCIQQPVACTEEAKVCPDGTTVGRNPALNCEFDPCPEAECKGEGETIPVIASPPSCCPNLELIPPKEEGLVGITGYCTAKCGDGTCDEETESSYNCPLDCAGGGQFYNCGDGICQEWEIAETNPGYCPGDCIGGGQFPGCRDESYNCTIEEIPCCAGLKEAPLAFEENGECIAATCGSVCLPCGDGECQANENKCNCPEDCSSP